MVITGPEKKKATFGVRAEGCVTFFIIGGGATAVLQESCVQPEVTILHLGGGSSSVELKDIVMHIFWSRNQDPVLRLYQPLIVSPVSVSPPFPD